MKGKIETFWMGRSSILMETERQMETQRRAMRGRTHDASRIKTLRLAVRPGASVINQLAAALAGRRRERAALISVAGFFFPYLPGFPVFAYPGRKPLAPVFVRPRH
jgi:hypothetical protein